MKFNSIIGDNLAHKLAGYDIRGFFQSAVNWIRILAMSAKIMLLVHIVEPTQLLFDRKLYSFGLPHVAPLIYLQLCVRNS